MITGIATDGEGLRLIRTFLCGRLSVSLFWYPPLVLLMGSSRALKKRSKSTSTKPFDYMLIASWRHIFCIGGRIQVFENILQTYKLLYEPSYGI